MNDDAQRTIRPLGTMVVCRVLEETGRVTPGGILIPDTVHSRPNRAVVLAVGPGAGFDPDRRPVDYLERGQRVVFHPYKIKRVLSDGQLAASAGSPFANHGESFLIDAEDVLGVETEHVPGRVEIEAAFDTLHAVVYGGYGPESNVGMAEALETLRDAFLSRYEGGSPSEDPS